MKYVPRIDKCYWSVLIVASIVGANAGDFLSDVVDLGHVSGLPFLAAVLLAIFTAASFGRRAPGAYYWAAIITIRAAATNIGDCLHDFGISFAAAVPAVAALLVAVLVVWHVAERRHSNAAAIPVDGFYWVSMTLAGILGTLAGDAMSYAVGLGNLDAMLVFAVPLAAALALGGKSLSTWLAVYWPVIALIRSAGTAAGDLLAHGPIGLVGSTALTAAVFAGLVFALYVRRRDHLVAVGSKAELLPSA
ncbi:MAG: hypothetical protein P4L98_15695 [Ancalomicrobiaceae bacterium]|nr:hypothetical protein [Ancalomicrobiaceae bacterium]